jgi:colicin import membrane protein
MRSGPIRAEQAEQRIDRRAESLALWERGRAASIDLPWTRAEQFNKDDLKSLLANATTVAVAVATTDPGRSLLEAALEHAPKSGRTYVYCDRAIEVDSGFVRRLGSLGDRVLVRLGYRLPADWLVVDQGRQGLLVVGPPGAARRWVIPVDGAIARSLFEAFRVLFWFHSSREALPDAAGNVAFRAPLAAPFDDPGADLPLAAGHLRFDAALDDPVPDADIRVSPQVSDPGPARVVFIPPTDSGLNGVAVHPLSLDLPAALARSGKRLVWSDVGLPKMTITRQRAVLDLVDAPVALQLEWPRAAAIDLFHRLERVATQPEWEFHPARRLGDVQGEVLLHGARQPAKIQPSVTLDGGDASAPLMEFDTARPARLPAVPPLALEATIRWRRVPPALPAGSRTADLVRSWTAVDEWAARQVEAHRGRLDSLDGQEGLLAKLRRWLPSRDAAVLERRRLRDELEVLGDARPSQAPEQARQQVDRLVQIGSKLDALQREAHEQRQSAEDAQAHETQKAAWETKVETAESKLLGLRAQLGANEEAQKAAKADEQTAREVLDELVGTIRLQRLERLEQEGSTLEGELEAVRAEVAELESAHRGRPPKAARKELSRKQHQAEQAVARNKREREGAGGWTPQPAELGDAAALLNEASKRLADLGAQAKVLVADVKAAERDAAQEFRFERPPRIPGLSTASAAAGPQIPAEAPPELGELFEHQGRRYLALRTWEQVRRAEPVARRLNAELVAAASS